MATTKLYLDTRGLNPGKEAPVKLAVTQNSRTILIPLNVRILPSQWDRLAGKIIVHPNKAVLNNYIGNRRQTVDNILLKLSENGKLHHMSSVDLKKCILRELMPEAEENTDNLFVTRFLRFADSKKGRTKELYYATYRRMEAYMGDRISELAFEDITKEWLTGFDTFLAKTSPAKNARNIHMRNIRAVFNEAIDDGVTAFYPFRRFKIRPEQTVKRALPVERIRNVFNYQCDDRKVMNAVDMFKLIFFCIGINFVDVFRLSGESIRNGRIEYYRAKTHRLYSIKLEPEAMEILQKYKGVKRLISLFDNYSDDVNYKPAYNVLNKFLQRILPQLSTYSARHSWATIAASLDIPKETIAAALGHGGNTVTDIYIDFDRRKVDEANRQVMDWVLYGKR